MFTLLGSCVLVLLTSSGSFFTGSLLGISLQLFYYIDGHHDPQSFPIVIAHGLLMPVIFVAVIMTRNDGLTVVSLFDSILKTVGIWTAIHLGLILSMVVYRVLFHPLRRIPGPFWARVTKIPHMVVAYRGKMHELHTEWAREYGPIVRIGQYSKADQGNICCLLSC